MDGDIRAYSKPGAGTTFVACIPTTAMPLNKRPRIGSESMVKQLTEKRLKALVADDSPFNVTLICDYLLKFEATIVSAAYNGYDAFLKYQACKIANVELDLVLLDIDMPVMDGRTACDKIREYEEQHQLKPVGIILISGNYDKEQIDEYINPEKGHKADAFLRKPVSFNDFNHAVYNLIYSGSR